MAQIKRKKRATGVRVEKLSRADYQRLMKLRKATKVHKPNS